MKKIVLTGAAGRLGSYLREPLSKLADVLLSTDLNSENGNCYDNEIYQVADLANQNEVLPLLENTDLIVHFGALSNEAPFEKFLAPNFIGSYNIWESARLKHVPRIIYASSIHAVGMYPSSEKIHTEVPHRPDTFYGLSKSFTENLARMYWDKYKIETVCLRILSCAKVTSERALSTWLSYNDLIHLVEVSIKAPSAGFSVIYGVSNNERCNVNNGLNKHLNYYPKDNAEQFATDDLIQSDQKKRNVAEKEFHGGPFAVAELGSDAIASMNIVHEKKSN